MTSKTLAVLSGILVTLGFAPFHLTPLLLLGMALIYRVVRKDILPFHSFKIGIIFGSSFFLTSLYWISISIATDLENLWYLIIPTPILLSLFLSLYFASGFLVFSFIKYKNPITFTIIIIITEYLRGMLFSGFPWNSFGYSFNSLEILQFASVSGITGLSVLIIFTSSSIGELMYKDSKTSRCYLAISILLIISIFCFGARRLYNNPTEYSDKKVRIVQGSVKHKVHWDDDYKKMLLKTYIELTLNPALSDIDYVIWPESSIPVSITNFAAPFIKSIYLMIGKPILASGIRFEDNKFFNSVFLLKDGEIINYYDKVKLVPLGEYVPLEDFIPLSKIVDGAKSFSHGTNKEKIFEEIDCIPTLCYEGIFPSSINRKGKASWILNLTNDSWFGISSAPYQHLHMIRVRSIEYGLPTIRSATTGISAVIDSYGRIVSKIGLYEKGILDSYLPKPSNTRTIYSKVVQKQ